MAIVSFDNIEYQSGKAVISKTKVEGSVVTIWFKLKNGPSVRETYRMEFQKERDRLKALVKVFLGEDITDEIDLEELEGQTCCVKLEERPWGNRTWTGVKKVWPAEPEGESEYEPEYEPEYEYEQPLLSSSLEENTVRRPRKIAPAPKPVPKPALANPSSEEESEIPSTQPAKKSPMPASSVGGSGRPRPIVIGQVGKSREVNELFDENDED